MRPFYSLFYMRNRAIWQPLPKGGRGGGNIIFFLEAQFTPLSPDIAYSLFILGRPELIRAAPLIGRVVEADSPIRLARHWLLALTMFIG